MQTIGEEQNFQTLFRKLKLEDARVAPRFSVVWQQAQASAGSRRRLMRSFVAVASVAIIAIVSIALWLRGETRLTPQPIRAASLLQPARSNAARQLVKPDREPPLAFRNRLNSEFSARRIGERKRQTMPAIEESEITDAVVVTTWQSPTANLMQSPANDLVTTLPQLYQTVIELNSFLNDTSK